MYLPKEDVPQTMTYVIGNPLIALTMLKHDINSALHVPFRFSVNEEPNGGSSVCYIIPSSQIAIGALTNPADEKALRDAAMVLDEKVEALARHVTGTVSGSLEKESSSQAVDARL
ncbi:hypothetical protein DL93DRAFT_2078974 [Clavulina sp. PMI_390]|nr:hypothetical protein DL93DRAFT_2078974 [Clavulina sp. PMI_390]